MRDPLVSFRLTPEMYEELQAAAQAHGESVSLYIRRSVEARLRPALPLSLGASKTVGYEPPRGISVTLAGGYPVWGNAPTTTS